MCNVLKNRRGEIQNMFLMKISLQISDLINSQHESPKQFLRICRKVSQRLNLEFQSLLNHGKNPALKGHWRLNPFLFFCIYISLTEVSIQFQPFAETFSPQFCPYSQNILFPEHSLHTSCFLLFHLCLLHFHSFLVTSLVCQVCSSVFLIFLGFSFHLMTLVPSCSPVHCLPSVLLFQGCWNVGHQLGPTSPFQYFILN